MTTDESRFHSLADRSLQILFDTIDAERGDDIDAELKGGILTLELESGAQYVINKHAATRQLWLSSPVSGAHHFVFDEGAGTWGSTRGAVTLAQLMRDELGLVGPVG